MIIKNAFLIAVISLGLTGCIVYDDGMPPPPRNYPMLYEPRIGYPYTHHTHHHVHYMPERGPAGKPAAKQPVKPKPCTPSRGTQRRNMPPTVR